MDEAVKVDNVNHPKHYEDSTSLECIEAMEIAFGRQAVIDFCRCNAFKYVWRYKYKHGKEDLEKALWYCDKTIELQDCEDEQIAKIIDIAVSGKKKLLEDSNGIGR